MLPFRQLWCIRPKLFKTYTILCIVLPISIAYNLASYITRRELQCVPSFLSAHVIIYTYFAISLVGSNYGVIITNAPLSSINPYSAEFLKIY